MKVLFFLTSSMEKPSPSWHLIKTLLEDVLEAGISVHAIEGHYRDSKCEPFPKTILNNPNFSFSLINYKVIDRKNLFLRYINGIIYAFKSLKHYIKNNDYDLIFIQSAPTSLFYIMTAKIFAKGRPIVYNCQDMFPGSAIANGSMPQKWIQKIFYSLQRFAYKNVDYITAISEDMKKKLLEQKVSGDKIKVIVNWYDEKAIYEIPWEKNRFVLKYGLSPDLFYVQYAGTMGTNFNPDIILDVAELTKEYDGIVYQMVGDGVRKDYFVSSAKKKGLSNIIFYPLQPQEIVADVYSACSICIIALKEGVIGNSVPSKAGLLMACHRTIVNSVDEDSEYGAMFERERIGFSSGINDSVKLANDIIYLYKNKKICDEYGQRAYDYGKREYSSSLNTKKYIDLFKDLVGNENINTRIH